MTSETSPGRGASLGSSLSRGQACIICRRKKMKCDGARPFCGPCSLTRHPDHCEYTDKQGRTFTEVLEERVRILKARIKDLEERQNDEPVLLSHPYPQALRTPYSGNAGFSRIDSPARLSEGIDRSSPPESGHDISWPQVPIGHPSDHLERRVAPEMDQRFEFPALLQIFLPHAQRLRFSLHVPSFLNDVAHPVEDLYPHICLISAISLWAVRIMKMGDEHAIHERYSLQSAKEALHAAQSSPIDRHRVQAIQTEILLALYFFNDGRVLEGRYHINAAGTAVLACGLHQILVPRENPTLIAMSSPLFITGSQPMLLRHPQTAIELTERINIFWTVYALDRCWSVALGCPPAIVDQLTSGIVIKAPLPHQFDLYQNSSVEQILNSSELSIQAYLEGLGDCSIFTQQSSLRTALVVASALFERATWITNISPGDQTSQNVEKLTRGITNFNEAFRGMSPSGLSSSSREIVSADESRVRLLARSLGVAATIQLQCPRMGDAEADAQCHNAVRQIVALIRNDPDLSQGPHNKVDFFLGVIWLSAARILVSEMASLSSPPTPMFSQASSGSEALTERLSVSVPSGSSRTPQHVRRQLQVMLRAQEIAEDLEILLRAIRILGRSCPLIGSDNDYIGQLRNWRRLRGIDKLRLQARGGLRFADFYRKKRIEVTRNEEEE